MKGWDEGLDGITSSHKSVSSFIIGDEVIASLYHVLG